MRVIIGASLALCSLTGYSTDGAQAIKDLGSVGTDQNIYGQYPDIITVDPTANISLSIENSDFAKGRKLTIVNKSSSKIATIKDSSTPSAKIIRTVYPGTTGVILCIGADPCADGDDWQGIGTIVSDWISGATCNTSWNNESVDCKYKRVGDTVEVYAHVTFPSMSPSNGAGLDIDMPDNLEIDTAKLSAISSNGVLGQFILFDQSQDYRYVGIVRYNDTDKVRPENLESDGGVYTRTNTVTDSSMVTINTNDALFVKWKVPVQGWTTTKG